VIEQITTLRALTNVVFHDDKEGLFGMRISGWLESPMEKGGIFSEASGRPTRVSGASSPEASGVYLTSEGRRGDQAWGTHGRWCVLTGRTGDKVIAIAILDHPRNPEDPTYWMARGNGLFAANPRAAKSSIPAHRSLISQSIRGSRLHSGIGCSFIRMP